MSHYPFIARCLLSVFVIMCGTAAHAEDFFESEPNDACFAAQTIGPWSFPSTVTGSLDSTAEIPDVDFFRFEGVPGQEVQVDLEGSYIYGGTLSDPFLGMFNSDCALLAINDDANGLNSRLVVVVPDDGVFILGVTNCCDSAFIGGGFGSYRLTLDVFSAIDSISGRLVNANTGEPVSGADPTYASANLLRCNDGNCFEYVSYVQAGDDGSFSFELDQYGNSLAVGTYQVQAYANGFEFYAGAPFDVAEGEMKNLGDLPLVPLQFIGTISGRLVDSVTNNPLPGNVPPYPYLLLNRCEDWGCYGVVYVVPDDMGNFTIAGNNYYLSPGTYQLVGFAQQDYQQATSAQFTVAAFQDVNFGDFALTPFPIQFGAIQACDIPFGSETCNYSIEITNRGVGRRYKGQAWSIVEFYDPTNNGSVTRFQVGRNGFRNPLPEQLNLKRGQSETLTFELDVPASAPVGATVCTYIAVGKGPVPQFNSQGDRHIFCSYKQSDGVVAMSAKESRKWLEKRKNRDSQSNGLQDRNFTKRPNRGFDESRPF